ncbi:hypothetical protein TNCV_2059511 [Trichonephila clavipes]|uniref:Uncharacterized protein n=1 Tax=Trichonephila clavipes TaxID=2585209 RepID=A0A8X6RB75_TRICX|nr:hypothetical protein TNCV_2059511 [Trichonephila clavipes]
MFPIKRKILKKEIEDLLETDIVGKYGSPYETLFLLPLKLNRKFCLYIDYRKLNEVPDINPLPRMNDLPQEVKY